MILVLSKRKTENVRVVRPKTPDKRLFLEDTEYIVSKNRRAYFPCFLSVENEGCICLAFPIAVGHFVMYIQLNILQNLLLDREKSLGQRFFEGVGEVGGRALIYNLQLAFNY